MIDVSGFEKIPNFLEYDLIFNISIEDCFLYYDGPLIWPIKKAEKSYLIYSTSNFTDYFCIPADESKLKSFNQNIYPCWEIYRGIEDYIYLVRCTKDSYYETYRFPALLFFLQFPDELPESNVLW